MGAWFGLLVLAVVAGGGMTLDYAASNYWFLYDDYFEGITGISPYTYSQSNIFNGTTCNDTSSCPSAKGLTCGNIEGLNDSFCVCDKALGYSLVDSFCTHLAVIGEICMDVQTTCSDNNAECREDGSNVGQRRCLCSDGWVGVVNETALGGFTCHERIHDGIDPACKPCEKNGGMCYDIDGDDLRDGCVCPIPFSGDNCGFQNVNVTCDVERFVMGVCYWPHSHMNFTDGVFIHVDGLLGDPACWGVKAEVNDTYCPEGAYKLELPLDEEDRGRCNTDWNFPSVHNMQFENQIVVHGDRVSLTENDVIFRAYCTFTRYADGRYQPLGLISINQDDRGEHKKPELSLTVQNMLGYDIPEGISIRLGDKVKLRMKLTTDGTYAAIRILRCTASNKPTIPDPKAVTVPLIINGCPYFRQRMITAKNTWRRKNNRPYDLETGAIKMFRMAQGNTVHLHCATRLCLTGSTERCKPVACPGKGGSTFAGYGRRKRDIDDELEDLDLMNMAADDGSMDILVHRQLLIEEESLDEAKHSVEKVESSSNKSMFMVVILGMVGLLLVVLVALGLFAFNRISARFENTATSPTHSYLTTSSELETSFSPQPKIATVENHAHRS